MSESWTWTCEDPGGESLDIEGAASAFPSQADAEAWLTESWQELAEAGAAQVSLLRDGQLVYGPMSLAPE